MRLGLIVGALVFVVLGAPLPAVGQERVALIIGNSKYEGAALRNPANDAEAMAATLKKLGFKVTKKLDLERRDLERAVLDFHKSLKKGSVGLFFYAGHGVQVKGENYLVPVNANLEAEFEVSEKCYKIDQVVAAMDESQSSLKIVILDCCRDNPFTRSTRGASKKGMAAMADVPDGTVIAFATSPGRTAEDGRGGNSPYTTHLIASLNSRPKGGLELTEALREASRAVKKETGQVPWLNLEASLDKFYLWRDVSGSSAEAPAVDLATGVKPNGLFGDNMVLQADKKLTIWGTAASNGKVTVSIAGQKAETNAADGQWRLELAPLRAGGPHTLLVEGANKWEFKNVLVGEVWICSGQSNMQWSVSASSNPAETIAAAKFPKIRLFTVPRAGKPTPQADVSGQWEECSPQTVENFSAVAYHFGSQLHKKLDVPIGLISSNLGGTPAQRWVARSALDASPELQSYATGTSSDLYNAMIAPLTPFSMRGVIWYQGESNAGQAHRYRTLFPALIKNWRDAWNSEFPFLFVQLPPFQKPSAVPEESPWAELREAQLLTLKRSPKTAMAVITDAGDAADIHPREKKVVGERLAIAARAVAYGEKIEYSGPIYDSMEVKGREAVLTFKHAASGLVVKGDKLTGFAVAGADKKFHNADARIIGNTVVVSSSKVEKPVAIRFGWAQFPVVTLWNKAGLPASPFRTDDFPIMTLNN